MTNTPRAKKVNILSWNVNGLQNKIKRTMVLQYLHRHAPDIVLLQETHLIGNRYKALNRFGYTLQAHAGFTTGSRGTGILIKNTLPFVMGQKWQDPLGRYAAVTGRWEGLKIILCSVYIPPKAHNSTLPDIGKLLLEMPSGTIILGGDMNDVMSKELDRTTVLTGGVYHLPDFVQAMGLVDLWRAHNPLLRQYTHVSAAHGTESRIDYILTQTGQPGLFQNGCHKASGISDHSPVEVQLRSPERDWSLPPRLDAFLFRDQDFQDRFRERVEQYFGDNIGSVKSHCILWEAYKTVARDFIQSEIGRRRKEKTAQMDLLESELLTLESTRCETDEQDKEKHHQLRLKEKELKDVGINQAKFHALATQRRIYDLGDKANKMIAWLEKRDRDRNWVPGIRTAEGGIRDTGVGITEAFVQYYEGIYQTPTEKGEQDCTDFLHDIRLPTLDQEDRTMLDSDITVEEVEAAMGDLQAGGRRRAPTGSRQNPSGVWRGS